METVKVVRSLPETAWRRFLEAAPDANVFHTPEMHRVFAAAKGYRPDCWAAVAADGSPLALLPVVAVTVGNVPGPLRVLTTRSVAYGSLMGSHEYAGGAGMAALLQAYTRQARRTGLFTELRNLADTSAYRPTLARAGYLWEDHLNFLFDLTRGREALWEGIRNNARRNVTKAQREGVTVTEAVTAAELSTGYGLLQGVYRRLQVPLANRSLFEAAARILGPAGMFKMWLARVGDVAAGAMTWLLYNGRIIYWYTGVDKTYSSFRANDLLVWHCLEWGSANGYRLFDFGGAGKPDEEYGVRDFKAKFGGELVNLGRYQHTHHPLLLKGSETAYGLLRRFL